MYNSLTSITVNKVPKSFISLCNYINIPGDLEDVKKELQVESCNFPCYFTSRIRTKALRQGSVAHAAIDGGLFLLELLEHLDRPLLTRRRRVVAVGVAGAAALTLQYFALFSVYLLLEGDWRKSFLTVASK